MQTYDMGTNRAESINPHDKHPEVVQRLTKRLTEIITTGRSALGFSHRNDVPIAVNRSNRKAAQESTFGTGFRHAAQVDQSADGGKVKRAKPGSRTFCFPLLE